MFRPVRFSRRSDTRREESGPVLTVAERNRRRHLLGFSLCVALAIGALVVSAAVARPLATHRLTVVVPGDTGVRITQAESDTEFFCAAASRCTYDLPQSAELSLSPTGLFFGWTGNCPTSAPICTL